MSDPSKLREPRGCLDPAGGATGARSSLEHQRHDWDAATYDRVSDPQAQWGRRVIARLAPESHERILDLGCGTGRVTAQILALVPAGAVVGLDRSHTMLAVARQGTSAAALASAVRTGSIQWVRGDATALPFHECFDAVFSTATLHWIADHFAAFRSVLSALRSGGRLVAQCGGGRNLERLSTRAAELMHTSSYSSHFEGWRDPWNFAFPDPTREALERAGFTAVKVWLESTPVAFAGPAAYSEFIACVCVRPHLERLPRELHRGFVAALASMAASDNPPLTLDYWRLNIDARRPPA